MERKSIHNNVSLTFLPGDKFKRNRISVSFIVPNDKEKATMYAVLPTLLERGYEDYPDMCMFSKKLSSMYGASFSAATAVVGQNRYLRFTIQGIRNQYCLNGEDLLAEMTDVILGVIFRPCVEDGGFISDWLDANNTKNHSIFAVNFLTHRYWSILPLAAVLQYGLNIAIYRVSGGDTTSRGIVRF